MLFRTAHSITYDEHIRTKIRTTIRTSSEVTTGMSIASGRIQTEADHSTVDILENS
jgi:hypothetical protein